MVEKTKMILTLIIPHQGRKVLLGMKKRGFGKGRWNGFGGKLEPGETIENSAKRELCEEAGIEAGKLEQLGIVDFEFQNNPEISEVHIFKVHEFKGVPKESEEMAPKWFFVDEIPFKEMWGDDPYWLPIFLQGKKFRGYFLFAPGDKVIEHRVKIGGFTEPLM